MFLLWNQSINIINPKDKNVFMMPNLERMEIIMWIDVYLNWNMNFNSKIGNKSSFSYETKASISLIQKRRMCLWCPITKKNEIIMWINVYPNWKTNFDSKNGRKWCFSIETKASKSFISTSRMWLWCPIMKKKEIIMWINVYPNWKTNLILKMVENYVFLLKPKHQNRLSRQVKCDYGA